MTRLTPLLPSSVPNFPSLASGACAPWLSADRTSLRVRCPTRASRRLENPYSPGDAARDRETPAGLAAPPGRSAEFFARWCSRESDPRRPPGESIGPECPGEDRIL